MMIIINGKKKKINDYGQGSAQKYENSIYTKKKLNCFVFILLWV